ncbi:hypothetical protein QCA50_000053 [Cerrena zonata]|uniref:Uncharacterized protein n=1 Tax=Cerrena zonata TaxID=2478898 RepID=A0AAW0GTQ6_9APHY
MKCERSPSPGASLPTPPSSPRANEVQHSAVGLLDNLTAFYQQERYWVHHTRAALELAISKGIDAAPVMPLASPCDSTMSSCESDASLPIIKSEPESTSIIIPESQSANRKSLWMRRKAGMKLKLEGLAPAHRRRRPHRAPTTEPGTRLLEMFSELVDARMESCQRVSRLLRETSNRPSYCIC